MNLSPRCQRQTGYRPRFWYNAVSIPEAIICPHNAAPGSPYCSLHEIDTFVCDGCDRRLPSALRYGGPADNPPGTPPVCSSCVDESFAEFG